MDQIVHHADIFSYLCQFVNNVEDLYYFLKAFNPNHPATMGIKLVFDKREVGYHHYFKCKRCYKVIEFEAGTGDYYIYEKMNFCELCDECFCDNCCPYCELCHNECCLDCKCSRECYKTCQGCSKLAHLNDFVECDLCRKEFCVDCDNFCGCIYDNKCSNCNKQLQEVFHCEHCKKLLCEECSCFCRWVKI